MSTATACIGNWAMTCVFTHSSTCYIILPQLVLRCFGIAQSSWQSWVNHGILRIVPGCPKSWSWWTQHSAILSIPGYSGCSRDTQDSPRKSHKAWSPMDSEILSILGYPGQSRRLSQFLIRENLPQYLVSRDILDIPRLSQILVRESTHIPQYLVSWETLVP